MLFYQFKTGTNPIITRWYKRFRARPSADYR